MSDRSTQEFFPLLGIQKDPPLITKVTTDFDQSAIQRRQRYLTLTQNYIGGGKPIDDIFRAEYLGLERRVLKDFLAQSENYAELMDLLGKTPRDIRTINQQVEGIRREVAERNILPKSRYSLLPIIKSQGEFDESIKQLRVRSRKENPKIINTLPFSFPETSSVHIAKLYHWTPTQYVQEIMQKGLLPGVCAAKANGDVHPYIYATVMQNDFWGNQLSDESSKAKKGNIPFTQLELTYPPEMEACMRLPIIQVDSSGTQFLGEPWVDISSNFISLDRMVSAFVAYDRQQLIRAKSDPKRYLGYDYDPDEWIESKLVGEKIPPDALLSPYNYEFNEVKLTGYIPPENIKVT